MTSPALQQSLGLLRRRLRSVLAAFGLGRVLAVAAAGMGGIYAVDRLLAPPGLVRLGLGIFVAMALFRVAWKRLVLPLSASLSPSQLALWWEREHPELGGRLSCSVELEDQPGAASVEFLAETRRRACELLPGLDGRKAVPSGRAMRSLFGGLFLASLLVGFGLAFPSEGGAFLGRLAGEETPWPGATRLVLLPAWVDGEDSPRIPEEPMPGEHRLLAPADTGLTLRIRAEGRPPDSVKVDQDGKSRTMRNLGGGEFSFKVAPLSATTVFTFRGGDDQDGLPTLRLVPGAIPSILDWTVRVRPPRYTGREEELSTMNEFRIPKGTRMEARFRFASPPKRVHAHRSGGEIQLERQGDGWTFTVEGLEDGVAFIEVEAQDGFLDSEATSLRWWVEPDRPPRVSVRLPATRWTTVSGGAVPLLVEVEDDYGVADLRLLPNPLGPLRALPSGPTQVFLVLPVPPPRPEEGLPSPFHLEIQARDEGPGPGIASALSPRIEIVEREVMEERLAGKMVRTREDLETILSLLTRRESSNVSPRRIRRKMETILGQVEEALLERIYAGMDPGTLHWQETFSRVFQESGSLPRGAVTLLLGAHEGPPLLDRAGLLADLALAGRQCLEGPARAWENALQAGVKPEPIRQELEIQVRAMLEILVAWEDFRSAVNLLRNLLDRQRAVHLRTREASEG